MNLELLSQWQTTQEAIQSSTATELEAEGLYAIDGGVFQAKEVDGRVELWTWLGKAGYVIARTGFEIDAHGGLHDRIYDLESEQQMVATQLRFTVADLTAVTKEQAMNLTSAMSVDEFLQRFPDIGRAL